MRNLLFPSRVTKESVVQKIEQAKSLLADIEDGKKRYFLSLLQKRINDFESELSSHTISPFEKEQVLEQYSRFAKTLHQCLEYPWGAGSSIYYYHRQYYYLVGSHDAAKPNHLTKEICLASVGLCISLVIGSIPVCAFNPVIGAILLLVAIPLLFPSCFFLFIPDAPDSVKKKQEEITLFQEGAKLIRPDLVFEEESDINTESDFSEMSFIPR
ncbi:hypothetical protein [Legionella maioricensis]|uniref:23, 7 kDa protein n=1 Tax=Legionella maioricensis TaxID=2896528 RepID=A0A9X2IAM5_9GAMM|nr:hypothetical protein [Legionella maioricensis]MCL9683735.1 hypothetical protein [Legionella maioricensis]MCL9687509.1 hypothetical protein [Legionella maioricensis]